MLSKVIAWSPTRRGAVERLDCALAEVSILGLTSNVSYLRHLLADEHVIQGELDTGLIDRIPPPSEQPNDEAAVMAALLTTRLSRGDKEQDLWSTSDSWRIGRPGWALWRALDGHSRVWEVRSRRLDDHMTTIVGDATHEISGYQVVGDQLWADVDGQSWTCTFVRSDTELWLGCQGFTWHFQTVPLRSTSGSDDRAAGSLKSPMPGVVSTIHVRVGDQVMRDDTLVTVEAMKMEHSITAPFAGTVLALDVETGASVELGQTLVTIEAASSEQQDRFEQD
jgi:acetyl-CoA/propionyl-CoA carboxylase biotin carboxyl carrier protein